MEFVFRRHSATRGKNYSYISGLFDGFHFTSRDPDLFPSTISQDHRRMAKLPLLVFQGKYVCYIKFHQLYLFLQITYLKGHLFL